MQILWFCYNLWFQVFLKLWKSRNQKFSKNGSGIFEKNLMNLQISCRKLQIRVGPLTKSLIVENNLQRGSHTLPLPSSSKIFECIQNRRTSGSRFLKTSKEPAGRMPKGANELGQALDQFLWFFKNCSLQVKTSLMFEDHQGAHIPYPFIPTGSFFDKRAHHPTLVHFISRAKPGSGAWLFNSRSCP